MRRTRMALVAAAVWGVQGVALGAGAGGAPAPAPPGEQVAPAQDPNVPPANAGPKDVALWRSGFAVTDAVHVERARATRLQLVLVNLRYVERLRQLKARGGEAGARGAALEKGVNDAHAVQFGVLTGRWVVEPYRVCGYPALEFGSMLNYGKADPGDLAKHRAMLYGCVEQAQEMVKAMKAGNDALEGAMREAETALAAAGLGAQTPGAGQEVAAGPKAASPAKAGGDREGSAGGEERGKAGSPEGHEGHRDGR